jgi:uncharacterized membrane protein
MNMDSPTTPAKPGLLRRIRRTFIAGLLAALPLALTLAAIVWLAELIQRFFGPGSYVGKLLGKIGLRFVASEPAAYLIGVLITLGMIYLLGVLLEAGLKSRWQSLTDALLNRVPLVRTVYNALSKLVRMFESRDQSDIKSMESVMVHFGGHDNGTMVLALLTSPQPIQRDGGQFYAIMIPTAPVPFGGAILYVPVDWVERVDVNFDALFNIYMSMGVTSSDYLDSRRVAAPGVKK